MNNIRQIQALNKRELENAVPPEASWHADYRDTAYIYVGGLSFELSEGDIIAIFSQFGEPVHINLVRDKETGKSRGFAFLKYEDQRSTDLAVDNLGGTIIMGRTLQVDHTRYKRKGEGEEEEDNLKTLNHKQEKVDADGEGGGGARRRITEEQHEKKPMSQEKRELMDLIQNHDDEDPMKGYLIKAKKEEIEASWSRKRDRHHHHHHRHRSHRDNGGHEERSCRRRRG